MYRNNLSVYFHDILVSLTARLGMSSWHSWHTVEWDPRMQVMAACRRLKFSRVRSHPRTILHVKSVFQLVMRAGASGRWW